MSQRDPKRRKKLMIVVVLMVVASTIAMATIMHGETSLNQEQFITCSAIIDDADVSQNEWDELIEYCMTYGAKALKSEIALQGLVMSP